MLEKPIDPPHLVGLLNRATRLASIPPQCRISSPSIRKARRSRFERTLDSLGDVPSKVAMPTAEAIKLPLPSYWIFIVWRAFLSTIRFFINH
jgi:hypothetical protein